MDRPKYEKPVVEDLSDIQVAEGICSPSGGGVNTNQICRPGGGGLLATFCQPGGNAGRGCLTGTKAG